MDKVKATGTRAEVMHGTAKKTSGGLTKDDLKYNNQGRIVSKKASSRAKKENRLVKAGYVTKKGQFGAVKLDGAKKRSAKKRSAKKRVARRSTARRSAKRSARRSSKRR
jgi:hypothetical protein